MSAHSEGGLSPHLIESKAKTHQLIRFNFHQAQDFHLFQSTQRKFCVECLLFLTSFYSSAFLNTSLNSTSAEASILSSKLSRPLPDLTRSREDSQPIGWVRDLTNQESPRDLLELPWSTPGVAITSPTPTYTQVNISSSSINLLQCQGILTHLSILRGQMICVMLSRPGPCPSTLPPPGPRPSTRCSMRGSARPATGASVTRSTPLRPS